MKVTSWAFAVSLLITACSARGCSRSQDLAPAASTSAAAPSTSVPGQPSASAITAAQKSYGTSALTHLPNGCTAVGRIEWRVLVNHPFLAPLLRRLWQPESGASLSPEQHSFFSFLSEAKLDLQRDVEQVAFCVVENEGPTFVVSGALPPELTSLLRRFAPKSEHYRMEQHAGVNVLTKQDNSFLQAEDRAFIAGSKLERLLAASKAKTEYESYGLPSQGELAMVANGKSVGSLLMVLLPAPVGAVASHAERAVARFDLGSEALVLETTFGSAEEAELLKSWLSKMLEAMAQEAKPRSSFDKALRDTALQVLAGARYEVQDKVLKLTARIPLTALAMALAAKSAAH
ncbi:MAG TPA: hypothetical protein VHM70_28700 [Polyangiaceae bacterium]|nr:hypothetical protein [Polyangiaceae bacterium]